MTSRSIGRNCLAVGALIVGMLCTSCGSARHARAAGPDARFAGYTWSGPVKSVSASWTVPAIRARSKLGQASTWIGASAAGSAQTAPFIQLGTQEELDRTEYTTGPGPGDFYAAFWSDTAHGFHPQYLFPVEAGDRITATMTLAHHRWVLAIHDLYNSEKATFRTRQEATVSFSQASWIQEDPTSEKTNAAVPYPSLTPVRISKMTVNHWSPPTVQLIATDMTLPAGTIKPSLNFSDSFEVLSAPSRR